MIMTNIRIHKNFVKLSLILLFFVIHLNCLQAMEPWERKHLAQRSPTMDQLQITIENEQEKHRASIRHLDHLWETAVRVTNSLYEGRKPDIFSHKIIDGKRMKDPIQAFIYLNEIKTITNLIDRYHDMQKKCPKIMDYDMTFREMYSKGGLPYTESYSRVTDNILRFQALYRLSVDDIVSGKLSARLKEKGKLKDDEEEQLKPFNLTYVHCFIIGQRAYHKKRFSKAFDWFNKALEMIGDHAIEEAKRQERKENYAFKDTLSSIFDYASITAYENGKLEYAIELNKKWLELEPRCERAMENLDFYLELAEEKKQKKCKEGIEDCLESFKAAVDNLPDAEIKRINIPGYNYQPADPESYSITEDKVVDDLCRDQTPSTSGPSKGTCSSKVAIASDVPCSKIKIETMFQDPKVVRIYDVISPEEAEILMDLAEPRLMRSTIRGEGGTTESDFRIARTAWLSKEDDIMVKRIEDRLSQLLNVSMEGSEKLQVVNYDIGGLYGPHLDAQSKKRPPEGGSDGIESEVSERMATILIYLNSVRDGGSTVFPRLNLTVKPIARSAVFWFNLKKNGLADEMMIHSGCPVLTGTKWIATKWPRDRSNIFKRPCGRKESD